MDVSTPLEAPNGRGVLRYHFSSRLICLRSPFFLSKLGDGFSVYSHTALDPQDIETLLKQGQEFRAMPYERWLQGQEDLRKLWKEQTALAKTLVADDGLALKLEATGLDKESIAVLRKQAHDFRSERFVHWLEEEEKLRALWREQYKLAASLGPKIATPPDPRFAWSTETSQINSPDSTNFGWNAR
jgi:hypothetical protein